ncbi:MAG: helix-turn-helix transcriptional regulator [Atribacterota bacterium]|jgi:transcriptional regulator with XRE-family HTH domain|nr:helix-turn-helix transcriptional regulator [Atribacterota bacterium]
MIGKTLKIERIRADIPQWKLAEAMGIPQSLLSMMENGRATLSEDMEKLYLRKLKELKSETKIYEN